MLVGALVSVSVLVRGGRAHAEIAIPRYTENRCRCIRTWLIQVVPVISVLLDVHVIRGNYYQYNYYTKFECRVSLAIHVGDDSSQRFIKTNKTLQTIHFTQCEQSGDGVTTFSFNWRMSAQFHNHKCRSNNIHHSLTSAMLTRHKTEWLMSHLHLVSMRSCYHCNYHWYKFRDQWNIYNIDKINWTLCKYFKTNLNEITSHANGFKLVTAYFND